MEKPFVKKKLRLLSDNSISSATIIEKTMKKHFYI